MSGTSGTQDNTSKVRAKQNWHKKGKGKRVLENDMI
jgi:hypothetical protein